MVSAQSLSENAEVCGDTGWFNGLTSAADISITIGDADLDGNVWLGGTAANAQMFGLDAVTRSTAAVFLHSHYSIAAGTFTSFVVDKVNHSTLGTIDVNGVKALNAFGMNGLAYW